MGYDALVGLIIEEQILSFEISLGVRAAKSTRQTSSDHSDELLLATHWKCPLHDTQVGREKEVSPTCLMTGSSDWRGWAYDGSGS